jgi:hypothetical protein
MAETAGSLTTAPSLAAFEALVERLVAGYTADAVRAEEELIPGALAEVASWPARFRVLPPFFCKHVLAGKFLGLLRLAKVLSLSEVTWSDPSADYLRGPAKWKEVERLRALVPEVLSRVPPDARLERLTISFDSPWLARQGIRSYNRDFFFWPSEEVLAALLGSPLCSELRVLNLSAGAMQHDIHQPEQDDDMGRSLDLAAVVKLLRCDTLEVLSLFGHGKSRRVGFATPKEWKRLATLRSLDLGGGFPFTDEDAAALPALPALERLFLRGGRPTKFLLGRDLQTLSEELKAALAQYWSVYEFKYDKLRLTKKGLATLLNKKKRPALKQIVFAGQLALIPEAAAVLAARKGVEATDDTGDESPLWDITAEP